MRIIIASLIAITTILFLENTAKSETSECLKYTPEITTLTGTLWMRKYYGPPNYGEDPKTDSLDNFYFLELNRPICVSSEGHNSDDDSNDESEFNVTELQLDLYDPTRMKYPKERDLLKMIGRRFTITGTLWHAAYAHDHTPVYMNVKSIMPAK
ncbi:DUF4431 domain-containing protein [Nitrospirillum sp. BR 11163]|uniref:DUF4431 domain-containing protein n=1 Tax=Nitrospirillum sp. BR 11163 TaxID=3104323 RepID=UPI002AFEBF04|nr:DUF4431 domain-containing protein [Nitrospirillum sp. BR 11163]MEA1677549.1 DUF4431 domain-containing protein [Nitrospirillum sp. BR 11163]